MTSDEHLDDDPATYVERADRANGEPGASASDEADGHGSSPTPPGTDTATGTDPDAKYEQPGYEDKSFGQAVDQDQTLVEDLLDETGGDVVEAERRFQEESTGRPAAERQAEG